MTTATAPAPAAVAASRRTIRIPDDGTGTPGFFPVDFKRPQDPFVARFPELINYGKVPERVLVEPGFLLQKSMTSARLEIGLELPDNAEFELILIPEDPHYSQVACGTLEEPDVWPPGLESGFPDLENSRRCTLVWNQQDAGSDTTALRVHCQDEGGKKVAVGLSLIREAEGVFQTPTLVGSGDTDLTIKVDHNSKCNRFTFDLYKRRAEKIIPCELALDPVFRIPEPGFELAVEFDLSATSWRFESEGGQVKTFPHKPQNDLPAQIRSVDDFGQGGGCKLTWKRGQLEQAYRSSFFFSVVKGLNWREKPQKLVRRGIDPTVIHEPPKTDTGTGG